MPLYRAISSVTLGYGAHTVFWMDAWLSELPLSVRFPAMFSHALDAHASMHAVVLGGLDHALVPLLTLVGARRRDDMARELATVSLSGSQDCGTQTRCAKLTAG
jgi:hypothetical protein